MSIEFSDINAKLDPLTYDEEKSAEVFKTLKISTEPPKYTADWYRLKYPNFPDNYYDVLEAYSANS